MAMPPSLTDLRRVADRLATVFASTEERFLHIGGSLGTAIDILGRVNTAFETLRLELESPDVHLATRQIGEAARQVSALAVTLTGERGTFDRLTAASQGIAGRIVRLRKTVGAIKVLAINARIEAAHIADPNVDFSVFTCEIGRLAVLADASLDRFSGELGNLDKLLHAAGTGQTEFEENHKATLLAVAQRLEVSLRSVTNHRQQAATAALAIFETSRQVAQRIGEVVMALQIGDITRQRLEHVTHALGFLVQSLTPGGDGGGARPDLCHSLDDDQRHLLIATVCRLQSAQLTHAIQDFDREVRRIVTALQGMAGDARKILRLGKESYGASDNHGVSFLLNLEGELEQADRLIKGYREARTEVDRVAGSVSTGVAELFRHVEAVHNIEADMRIVGLNTALKCGRLGDQGRALSIIAQELRNDANRTVEEAAPIMAGLQEIVAVSAALSGRTQEDKSAEAAALTEAMAASVGRLGTADGCLTSTLGTLEQDSDTVATLLDDTSRITLHEEICRVLRDIAAGLDSIAGETRGDPAAMAQIKDLVLSLVKGRYTMESEREIHALFAEDNAGAVRPAPSVTPARKAQAMPEPVIDDFLF